MHLVDIQGRRRIGVEIHKYTGAMLASASTATSHYRLLDDDRTSGFPCTRGSHLSYTSHARARLPGVIPARGSVIEDRRLTVRPAASRSCSTSQSRRPVAPCR